jgi:hypothetical protein
LKNQAKDLHQMSLHGRESVSLEHAAGHEDAGSQRLPVATLLAQFRISDALPWVPVSIARLPSVNHRNHGRDLGNGFLPCCRLAISLGKSWNCA